MIEYPSNGGTGSGYLALPEGGVGPGVLVLHAWWGLNETFREVCDRLAQEGFVAFAPDLYEGEIARTIEEAQEIQQRKEGDRTYGMISSAITYLTSLPGTLKSDGGPKDGGPNDGGPNDGGPNEGNARIGALGFSMGAYWALLLEEPVAAVVVFYGTGDPDTVTGEAAIQGHFAEQDAYEPLEGVQEFAEQLQAGGKQVKFYTYPGTGHWFFEPDRKDAYDPGAADLAWQRTLAFFKEHLPQAETRSARG
jgi:carboxymethylenebutenolidase